MSKKVIRMSELISLLKFCLVNCFLFDIPHCFVLLIVCVCVCVYLQNAGAIIGKGGSNIKRLRTDVSSLSGRFSSPMRRRSHYSVTSDSCCF